MIIRGIHTAGLSNTEVIFLHMFIHNLNIRSIDETFMTFRRFLQNPTDKNALLDDSKNIQVLKL